MEEVTCWDPARRYFEKGAKLHKKSRRARVALTYIRTLYRLERAVQDQRPEKRFWMGRRQAHPVPREFSDGLEAQAVGVKGNFQSPPNGFARAAAPSGATVSCFGSMW